MGYLVREYMTTLYWNPETSRVLYPDPQEDDPIGLLFPRLAEELHAAYPEMYAEVDALKDERMCPRCGGPLTRRQLYCSHACGQAIGKVRRAAQS